MGWVDKVLYWVGLDVGEENIKTDPEEQPVKKEKKRERVEKSVQSTGTLVSLPGRGQWQVVAIAPESFDDVQMIADHLKERRPVILNLQLVDKDVAQKILNFLSGTVYALDGNMHRIGTGVLFFSPNNVELQEFGDLAYALEQDENLFK